MVTLRLIAGDGLTGEKLLAIDWACGRKKACSTSAQRPSRWACRAFRER
ncbi:hypothetical protein [Cohnella soli]|uniref:Uncharacterized protein n=1 Tax=Cohnella soli TaxID=425005 RepID=A0ABW0HQP3_9BACL